MDNWLPLIVAALGAGGFGAFFREIVTGVTKVIGGVSARESNRKVDIVTQRDAALARESKAYELLDKEAAKRRLEQEYSARLRRQLIEEGFEPEPAPSYEKTITKQQLSELRETENP